MRSEDSIAALATPPGIGGVGIVRISGPATKAVARGVLGRPPPARRATFTAFLDADGESIDQGIALFFPAPHSFTGEDVLELQGHGGPVVMDLLLQRVLQLGPRVARPGEFSERAFLNGKLDLAQAEAIADLVASGSAAAARLATRSLQGAFSQRVQELVGALVNLRVYVEAAIDFPEEEIDFLSAKKVSTDLCEILRSVEQVLRSAHVGCVLRDGISLVIAGRPNAGKSSLLNALAGRDRAIVTEIPGTTRDLLSERIQIDGIPVHLVDTAGLRDSADRIEIEGIRRARQEIETADHILWIFDDETDPEHFGLDLISLPEGVPFTLVRNKIDRTGTPPGVCTTDGQLEVAIAAKDGTGIDLLKRHLTATLGFQGAQEGEFIARRRHVSALERAHEYLLAAHRSLPSGCAGELLAEDLRQAQHALAQITGEFTSDDLLGEIFSSFCIGK